MRSSLELSFGLLLWLGVLWDGFATIILPRRVAPMRRYSGRFYKRSWRLWSGIGRRIRHPDLRLSFLAVYGPVSVMLLIVILAGLMIVAFALIYHGLGPRFRADRGPIGFGALLYMSGSTFLTLGLGDITSTDSLARSLMILETATGYIFLGLMITYMPLLHQAYGSREVGSMLIQSRSGYPPSGVKFLHRYLGTGHPEILESNLREAERWTADILQSHLSHPVLSFYRAQRWGQSWLVSLATVLDGRALLIAGSEGLTGGQARITYRMGLRLLVDLTNALCPDINTGSPPRLTEADLPALQAVLRDRGLNLAPGPGAAIQFLRLVRRYDARLLALSDALVIPMPSWIPTREAREADASDDSAYYLWNRSDPGSEQAAL